MTNDSSAADAPAGNGSLLSRARQAVTPGKPAPTQKVSGKGAAQLPLETAQAKNTPLAPTGRGEPSASTTSWWRRFSGKPKRTAFDFWSQDRLNP